MQSEKIDLLVKALVEVQSKLKPAKKNATNPFFQKKYADLESVWDSCRDLLSKAGLAVVQTTDDTDGATILITTLAHESGQFISGRLRMTPEKNTPQGIGSCITYSRRYGLSSIIGIVSDADDDGNEASATDTKTTAKPKAEPANVAPPLDLPKGKDWWCSSHNGKAYVLTKNKNKRYARAFLDAQGFRLNEKTGTFSHLHSDELVRLFQKMDEEVVSEFQTNMDEVFP